jgi:hypothetical protein
VLGVHLSLMIGPTLPLPATADIAEAVQSVSVTQNDTGRSGFQIVLQVGRSGAADLRDYRLLQNPLLRPFNRVILRVLFNGLPQVLMDGIITNWQFSPGNQPGLGTLTLTGEDVSVMMDLKKKRANYKTMSEPLIARAIILSYPQYGLVPDVTSPTGSSQPPPTGKTPVQQATDLDYLKTLGERFGHVFYVEARPEPGFFNTAYWGPPKRSDTPQRALTVSMGPQTNVEQISFTYNGLAATLVNDVVQGEKGPFPVVTTDSTRQPPLAFYSALKTQFPNLRTTLLEQGSGALDEKDAKARAQGITDKSVDNVATAQGELDGLQYGGVLKPRGVVGVRGAGLTHDGSYYVKSVSHSISKGQYKQRFSLTREGTGPRSPMVVP